MSEYNRRDFLKTAATIAAAATTGVALHQPEAKGQILASALVLEGLSGPILAFATMIEGVATLGMTIVDGSETKKRLATISNDIGTIASNQSKILDKLADQRIVMREEIRRGFLDNDARDLAAAAQQFKTALAGGDIDRDELRPIARDADHLAFKLGNSGLAAVPAYLSAIALQNSVHYALQSSPQKLVAINETHQQNLDKMLRGDGPETLPYLIRTTPKLSADESNDEALRNVHGFGRRFLVAVVTKTYRDDTSLIDPTTSTQTCLTYEGFKNGKPFFYRTDDPEKPDAGYTDEDIAGKPFRSAQVNFGNVQWTPDGNIPGLTQNVIRPIELNNRGQAVFTGDNNDTLQAQVNALSDYYNQFYRPGMGADITRQTVAEERARPANGQRAMRKLLQDGLSSVGKILDAAKRAEASASLALPMSPQTNGRSTPEHAPAVTG